MPENLMCPEHKSNSDAYRENWERTFHRYEDVIVLNQRRRPYAERLKKVLNDRDFAVVGNPFTLPAKFTFDPVNYGVVAVKTQKDNPCPKA